MKNIDKISKCMTFSMIANLFLSIIKIIGGVVGGSSALIADGFHSLSDLGTDIVGLIGNYFSKAPADSKHPYGHGKIDYVTSVIIGIIILIVGFSFIRNALSFNITVPHKYTIIVVLITLIVKFIVSSLLIKEGKKIKSNILISSGKESFIDVFSSILVFFLLILSQFASSLSVLKYADLIGTLIIGIIISFMGVKLLLENFSFLIDKVETDNNYINKVCDYIKKRNEFVLIDKIYLLKFGTYYKAIINILLDGDLKLKDCHYIIHKIENELVMSDLNIKYVTIDVSPFEE